MITGSCKFRMQDKLSTSRVLFIYYLLATGTVSAAEYLNNYFFLYFIIFFSIFVILHYNDKSYISSTEMMRAAVYLSPFFVLYLVFSTSAGDLPLLIRRIEGSIISTTILIIALSSYIKKYSEKSFYIELIKVAIIILALTVLYKLRYGFFDRYQVRFLINGPIVFSWLMCYCALILIYHDTIISTRKLYLCLFLFILAAIWSSSKGPIIALIICTLLIWILRFKRYFNLNAVIKIFSLFIALLIIFNTLPTEYTERITDIINIITNNSEEAEYGSVGIRQEMWISAYEIYLKNYFLGVGTTNWQYYSEHGELLYPHNIFLELASETGLIGLTVYLLTLITILFKTTPFGRYTLIYFTMCSSVSGDISYSRLILSIPIVLALNKSRKIN